MQAQLDVAETALLGACLINKKAPLVAGEYVAASDFYLPKHQVIFDAIVGVVARGGDADPVSVSAELGPRLESAGGTAYIFSLPNLCPSVSNIREYAQSVRDASLDRQLRGTVSDALEAHTGDELLTDLQDKLYQLDRRVEKSSTMADVWQRMLVNGVNPPAGGCEYPWQKIQWLTRGVRPGWLCILAGEPSHGKTAAALAITEKAIKDGKRVVFLSLEMGDEEIGLRLAQRRGLSSDRYYEGRMTAADADVIRDVGAASYWSKLHLDRVEKAGQISILIRRWNPDLVVIDHLQLLAGSEEVKELSKTTRQLKLTCERFQTPILCLSQLSRAESQERGKLPRLSRLRGSGTIEQDADTVVFVWRKRSENEELLPESALVVAKSRMGKLGAIRTHFDGDTQSFVPITDY